MAKYIHIEQAIEVHRKSLEQNKSFVSMIQKTPTIEVSEDCISRDYMLKLQRELHGWMPNDKNHELWQKIKDAPPVTPTERAAEWVTDEKNQGGFTPGGNSVKSCSLCGWIYGAHMIVPDYNYCPNCGAKMKG